MRKLCNHNLHLYILSHPGESEKQEYGGLTYSLIKTRLDLSTTDSTNKQGLIL